MADAGLTLDLAPVADTVATQDADDNPPIGRYDRQYGSDPAVVAADRSSVVVVGHARRRPRRDRQALPRPGPGRTRTPTRRPHAVDAVATANDPNLQPFAGRHGGRGHGGDGLQRDATRGSTRTHLAVFSPAIVTGLLRQQMG